MLLDEEFLNNTLEFPPPDKTTPHKPLLYDDQNWYPKFLYQQKSIEKICASGPATHKFKNNESIQAHLEYIFYFKWGGTSNTMETIADPSKQQQYPTPSDISSRIQIQDPTTDPRHLVYGFDFRRHILTQKAYKRLTEKPITDESIPFLTDYINPQPPRQIENEILQALIETQTKKKEKEENVKLFLLLNERRHRINQQLQQLITKSIKL